MAEAGTVSNGVLIRPGDLVVESRFTEESFTDSRHLIEFTDPTIPPAEFIKRWIEMVTVRGIITGVARLADGLFTYVQPVGTKEKRTRHGHLYAVKKEGNNVEAYFVDPENNIPEQRCHLAALRIDLATAEPTAFANVYFPTQELNRENRDVFKFRPLLEETRRLIECNGIPPFLQASPEIISERFVARPGVTVVEEPLSRDRWLKEPLLTHDAVDRFTLLATVRIRLGITLVDLLEDQKLLAA